MIRQSASKLFSRIGAKSMQVTAGKNMAACSMIKMNHQITTQARMNFSQQFNMNRSDKMFCFQCEQTQNGTGCTTVGVCGKTPSVAALQDLLIYQTRQLCALTTLAKRQGSNVSTLDKVDDFVLRAMYSTLTNVNFDEMRFVGYLKECSKLTQQVKKEMGKIPHEFSELLTVTETDAQLDGLLDQCATATDEATGKLIEMDKSVGVQPHHKHYGADTNALRELVQYGIKGLCAYTKEASLLGKQDVAVVNEYIRTAMCALAGVSPDGKVDPYNANDIIGLALKCGEVNVRTMQLMDEGAFEKFGQMAPNKVRTTPLPGKSILVSGHDMGDLLSQQKNFLLYLHLSQLVLIMYLIR